MTEWPADKVERHPVAKLIPYARNARTHSDAQVAQIAASIKEWGWTTPVLIDEQGGIIAGHGRVLAAQKLGIKEVPAMVATGWTEAQKRAYCLADNKLALNAGWDTELLKVELQELDGLDFDLPLIGFDDTELAKLLQNDEDQERAEETPEPPVNPVTIEGDVWLLGNHRIVCGDSTKAEDVDKAVAGAEVDFVFTSPPYAQQRKYGFKDGIEDWDALMQGVFSILPAKRGAQVLVNLGIVHKDNEWQPYWNEWIAWMRTAGWRAFGWYVWDQGHGLPGDWNGRPAPSHEFIFHFNRDAVKLNKTVAKKPENCKYNDHGTGIRGADGKMSGVSNRAASMQTHKVPDSVFRVMRYKTRNGEVGKHPAVFPVALVKEISDAFTKVGDHLYEPYSGSGTCIMACELTGRTCHAIEINPQYVDVSVERWCNFTGLDAIHEASGETFAAMKARANADTGSGDRESGRAPSGGGSDTERVSGVPVGSGATIRCGGRSGRKSDQGAGQIDTSTESGSSARA